MRLRRIIHASFEDGLNMFDDISVSLSSTSKDYFSTKPVRRTILLFLGFLSLYLFPLMITKEQKGQMGYSTVPKPTINFLPFSLFWVLQAIYLMIWGYSLFKRNKHTELFYAYFNANVFFLWSVLELNLFVLTLLFVPLTIVGVALLFLGMSIIVYIITRARIHSLEERLFDMKHPRNKLDEWIDKLLKLVFKYGGIVLIVVAVWKFIFPNGNSSMELVNLIGVVGVITGLMVLGNIFFIVTIVYLTLPYLLFTYYLMKYPEEYRMYEGKTQQEWYGEKYFKKHIKGTEKEEKDDD